MKQITSIANPPQGHWVGDGFPVKSLFSYHSHAEQLSPFLLLDHAGPAQFPADGKRRGVGEHPHRGFETVTIVYQGEVSHRDSAGNAGTIGPGDVQWMTAAAGIVHEEFHSQAFAQTGGTLEMVQLWVNLPANDKMRPPRYQGITSTQIPVVALADGGGQLRVIAGQYGAATGPAITFSPIQVWDVALHSGTQTTLPLSDGWNTALVVLQGSVLVNAEKAAKAGQLVVLSNQGSDVVVRADGDAKVLVLSGLPLNEPVVGHGPFVMNTRDEIVQAITDFNSGNFGRVATA